jgi:hypothetical protein
VAVASGRGTVGLALAAGVLAHGHSGPQAFGENSFVTTNIHIKNLYLAH